MENNAEAQTHKSEFIMKIMQFGETLMQGSLEFSRDLIGFSPAIAGNGNYHAMLVKIMVKQKKQAREMD